MPTFVVLNLEKNSVQIDNLSPGTAYRVKVQALGSDGSQGVSSLEEQFETLSEGTGKNLLKEKLTGSCMGIL